MQAFWKGLLQQQYSASRMTLCLCLGGTLPAIQLFKAAPDHVLEAVIWAQMLSASSSTFRKLQLICKAIQHDELQSAAAHSNLDHSKELQVQCSACREAGVVVV